MKWNWVAFLLIAIGTGCGKKQEPIKVVAKACDGCLHREVVHENVYDPAHGLPVYTCSKGASCDLETLLLDRDWDAENRMIDSFRGCHIIYAQQEDETSTHFKERLPHPLTHACVILRKRPQPILDAALFEGATYIHIFGGTINGNLASEDAYSTGEQIPNRDPDSLSDWSKK